jgi:hypothetical protein
MEIVTRSEHGEMTRLAVDARSLERDLSETIEGEVRFDSGSRALYATDSSNDRQVPIGTPPGRSDSDGNARGRKNSALVLHYEIAFTNRATCSSAATQAALGISVHVASRHPEAKKIVGPPSRRPWPARRRRYEIFEAGHD